ncbi:HD domain-containing protein [Conexibacter sp. JD483]|uniref:HD-GYP domain-containing protein n=1 Tax=unclassified Conexibacter TaxID=2627773 RepID=UPI00271A4C35|nr:MULTISPECIES: HD domain-containing phosphohydrolase [unclassified Conexibacter]MDO8186893.1 HD domain-containing protein [Conexibacter sp. CPCC 205706]MDO8200795.1 HD domain-containing protein [Conexibacter sp. CPCC 205762]MDR9369931.1 HD domain-containing protein [Conexibacter sp. JD483]
MVSAELEQLREELDRLRAELALREREAEQRAVELQRYAEQLRRASEREHMRALELRRSYEATVRALADAVEARDAYTGKHAERVAAYGLALARACGMKVDEPQIEFGFLLHDIGKVAISDAILHKPGSLTAPEIDVMRQHPVIGDEIVSGIDFLGEARHVVRSHHERWDGTGYPDRLAREQIPLAARVFAVADTFDALTSDRPYRAASSFKDARTVIAQGAGSQFDPEVAAQFMAIPDEALEQLRCTLL